MKKFVFAATMVLCLVLATSAFALERCKSQTIFVPALCNQFGSGVSSYTRLIIHNVDPSNGITLDLVDFCNPAGDNCIHLLLTDPVELDSWESVTFFVDSDMAICDDSGFDGNGGRPSFVVEWSSTKWVVPPSVRGAVGIKGLASDSSHAEAMNPGIVIQDQCK